MNVSEWMTTESGRRTPNFSLVDIVLTNTLEYQPLVTFNENHPTKWNESGFRPPLCTYRLNWARRTSWGWWDEWGDTVLQTQDSKFEPWRSEAEHATSRSHRLPTILSFTRGWGRNIFVSFKPPRPGTEPQNSSVKGSGANHYPRAPAHPPTITEGLCKWGRSRTT